MIANKVHLLVEDVSDQGILFARLMEQPENVPKCSALKNVTGLCIEWSWLEAVETSQSSLYLTTFVEETLHIGGPQLKRLPLDPADDQPSNSSQRWLANGSHHFYVAQPEAWELVLEHRLQSKSFGTVAGRDLSGFLRIRDEVTDVHNPSAHIFAGIPQDPSKRFGPWTRARDQRVIVPVKQLLESSSIHLDETCQRCAEFNVTGEKARLRQVGVELDVTLFYTNLWTARGSPWSWFFPAKDITFELHISARQPVEGVKRIRTVGSSELLNAVPEGVKARVVQRSHGIRMHFHQAGILGQMDMAHFLSFILASITRLTLAWTVVEVALDFMPVICKAANAPIPAWYTFLISEGDQANAKQEKLS